MRYLISICIIIFFFSCAENKRIEITKEYIINENWDENINVCIERMKVRKDSSFSIFDPKFKKDDPNHWSIVNRLKVDSNYIYNYYRENDSSNNLKEDVTVYFSGNKKGKWRKGCYGLDNPVNEIANLENDTWYKFSKLKTKPYFIYIYVDSIGNTHGFEQDLSNR